MAAIDVRVDCMVITLPFLYPQIEFTKRFIACIRNESLNRPFRKSILVGNVYS